MTTQASDAGKVEDVPKSSYPLIDADSHLEEGPEVFDYLDAEFEPRRPFVVDIGDAVRHRPTRNKVWMIDGEMRPKLFGAGPSCYAPPPSSDFALAKPIRPEVQSLMDVD